MSQRNTIQISKNSYLLLEAHMDNIKMMVLALFMPQTSEFPLRLFEKKKKKMPLKKDYFKYTDLSYIKETTKFMTWMLTFKLFNMSA